MSRSLVAERGPPLRDRLREGVHHVGNSTHWIVLGGVKILTDPWLSEPADGLLGHTVPPSPLPADPDLVLITHRHEDHFDPAALARLDRRATVLTPERDLVEAARALGFRDVRLVREGEGFREVRGVRVEVVRGDHLGVEVCYRAERRGRAIFFGGDSRVTREMERLADRAPVSLAILPGERSTFFGMELTMNPGEAVALARRFGARRAVLSHHEHTVTRRLPLGLAVDVPPAERGAFPSWFVVPSPGQHVAFP